MREGLLPSKVASRPVMLMRRAARWVSKVPTSLLDLAPTVLNMVHRSPARTLLDVGPGFGKYGLLLREYLGVHRFRRLDAVEAEERYIDGFPWLAELYDTLYLGDVAGAAWREYEPGSGDLGEPPWVKGGVVDAPMRLAEYDLVLMGDVLEHIDEAAAQRLLERIPGRVLVNTPVAFFQNPEADQGWETERHRSSWSVSKLARIRDVEQDASQLGAVLVMLAPL